MFTLCGAGSPFLSHMREMFRAFCGREGIDVYAPRTGAELQQMLSTMTAEEAEAKLGVKERVREAA